MILPIQHRVHDAIKRAILDLYHPPELPAFAVETPPSRTMGDLAVPVAFQLARLLKQAPRTIAQELAAQVAAIPGIAAVTATPAGYINFSLDRPAFVRA